MIRLTELLNVNFNKVTWTKQSENSKCIIYNVMINGKTGGRIIFDKKNSKYIATAQNSDNQFPKKQFSTKGDAVHYLKSFTDFSTPITAMGGSEAGIYRSYGA